MKCLVAGAALPVAVIEDMEAMGFDLTHVYGLTEPYGPAAACARHDAWNALSIEGREEQRTPRCCLHPAKRHDGNEPRRRCKSSRTTAWVWQTRMGEIMFRGNITLRGFLKKPKATEEVFAGGWYHTGDFGVIHPNGYAKIKDRSKNIIISSSENISLIKVEDILICHPAIMVAAVAAQPDEKWGETPCAFVELKADAAPTKTGVIEFYRARMARFKVPKRVVFGELPKTSMGKIQKFLLRKKVGKA